MGILPGPTATTPVDARVTRPLTAPLRGVQAAQENLPSGQCRRWSAGLGRRASLKSSDPKGWSGAGLRNGFRFSAFLSAEPPPGLHPLLARRECPNTAGSSSEKVMEIVYFACALILLSALIYGGLHTRYRNRYQKKVSDQIVRDRYEHYVN
jgi:hypothetical protein